jgi:hypothetical protein
MIERGLFRPDNNRPNRYSYRFQENGQRNGVIVTIPLFQTKQRNRWSLNRFDPVNIADETNAVFYPCKQCPRLSCHVPGFHLPDDPRSDNTPTRIANAPIDNGLYDTDGFVNGGIALADLKKGRVH